MGMEPFDYLTYKKNKFKRPKNTIDNKHKIIIASICILTFIFCFFMVFNIISSKTSKIDIEYGRLGVNTPSHEADKPVYTYEQDPEEYTPRREKYTIDKRLFLIQQEEKGPSTSEVVAKPKEHSEVISKEEFEMIKSNSEEIKLTAKKETDNFKTIELNDKIKENLTKKAAGQNDIKAAPTPGASNAAEQKIAIKPKLPVNEAPKVKPISALEAQGIASKVLIGKYATLAEARKVQNTLTDLPDGVLPFVKKINSYYTIQMGSYENFNIAKTVAAQYKQKGYDVWILQ